MQRNLEDSAPGDGEAWKKMSRHPKSKQSEGEGRGVITANSHELAPFYLFCIYQLL